MSAHINGKEVEKAYLNGKEVRLIYRGGKLVWFKYFPKGYELIIDKHDSNNGNNYLNAMATPTIISQTPTSTTWGDGDIHTYINLNDKTKKKLPPNGKIKIQWYDTNEDTCKYEETVSSSDFSKNEPPEIYGTVDKVKLIFM